MSLHLQGNHGFYGCDSLDRLPITALDQQTRAFNGIVF